MELSSNSQTTVIGGHRVPLRRFLERTVDQAGYAGTAARLRVAATAFGAG